MEKNHNNRVFHKLEGILNGHNKSRSEPTQTLKETPEEARLVIESSLGTGCTVADIVAIGFGTKGASGAEQLNAVYLTEQGVLEWNDLSMRQGYMKLKGLIPHNHVDYLQRIIDNDAIHHVMRTYAKAEKVAYNLGHEDNKKMLILYLNQESKPGKPSGTGRN